jgi:hypothetical protein
LGSSTEAALRGIVGFIKHSALLRASAWPNGFGRDLMLGAQL